MAVVAEVPTPSQISLIEVEELSQFSFAEFGTVIENPQPSLSPCRDVPLPANAVQANQGTALKYLDVTNMRDLYFSAPSKVASRVVMNMFVCAPRTLLEVSGSSYMTGQQQLHSADGVFPVDILERHPFTTQTFIPLGLSPDAQDHAQYLVIVAPSHPISAVDEELAVPTWPIGNESSRHGLPDLSQLRAFLANGSQAVTYGAGTWHAPMVVIGSKAIDFVVVQFANGVDQEDCQEVLVKGANSRAGSGIQIVLRDSALMGFTNRRSIAKL